mmetsp:Transcript_62030/g.150177  ORF Transcript_62030/g.150177 Transcript_62030/m.150177 type:complete len:256 (-) Transcript_62030:1224-1991(-)
MMAKAVPEGIESSTSSSSSSSSFSPSPDAFSPFSPSFFSPSFISASFSPSFFSPSFDSPSFFSPSSAFSSSSAFLFLLDFFFFSRSFQKSALFSLLLAARNLTVRSSWPTLLAETARDFLLCCAWWSSTACRLQANSGARTSRSSLSLKEALGLSASSSFGFAPSAMRRSSTSFVSCRMPMCSTRAWAMSRCSGPLSAQKWRTLVLSQRRSQRGSSAHTNFLAGMIVPSVVNMWRFLMSFLTPSRACAALSVKSS